MQIGSVTIDSRLALAPMAGVTDAAFRQICAEKGAGYTVTELVSAKALCYRDKKTAQLLQPFPGEHPFAAQIFGSDASCMAEAAQLALEISGADIIDINMGCPVPKIANSGDGSGLLRDLDRACRVAEAVLAGAAGLPVTVKLRTGWDRGHLVYLELGRMLESLGIAALTLHGRTKGQMYAGRADWDAIRALKQAVSIPVVANGDVFSAEDAVHILRYTGADAVMIARGAFGDPWIFQQAKAALAGEPIPKRPPLAARCALAERQILLAAEQKGERIACLEARKQYNWYLKGIPHASYWKSQIAQLATLADVRRITAGIARELRDPSDEG